MKIEHIAFWIKDLENIRNFYEQYFGAVSNEKYHNPAKHFESYFLSFDNGCRLEIMNRPGIGESDHSYDTQKFGIIHFAFSTGSREKVDEMTERLRHDGYRIAGNPHHRRRLL